MAIFVSYSHKNKKFVDNLCSNLVSEKIHVWLDRWELKPGDSLIDSVQTALEHAGAILVILSKDYVNSTWCKKELNASLVRELEEKGNLIVPIVIEDCDIPIFLREKYYADFRKEWDEAYVILAESLSKYINLDQGRLDHPTFYVDYSSEYFSLDGKIKGLRYQFVEHAENRPFSVLSVVHIQISEKWEARYQKYIDSGLEDMARMIFSGVLIQYFEDNPIKILLKDACAVRKEVFMHDPKNDFSCSVDFEIRWMGEDTGKTIVYWAGDSMKGALIDFLSKVRKPSKDELEELAKILPEPLQQKK